MASWLATGPPVIVCWVAGQRVDDLVVQVEVLDRAAADQHDRGNDRDRQQNPDHAADQVDPEVAELTGVPAREAPHHRDRDSDTHRGRREVLHGQTGHLHEMADRSIRPSSSASWCW